MDFEKITSREKIPKSVPQPPSDMTLQKAVDLGEYDPQFLSTFSEWHTLSRHIQFQYIRTALENRNHHLITQWAEINNILDFRLKPKLKTALKNIERQLKKLSKDKEKLYLEYST
jgi:hypothetical protein